MVLQASPQPLREAILARAVVRRLADGAMLSARGAPAEEWCGVARGAVRVSSVSLSGKQVTLTYVEPGIWFGDIALFDGKPRTHDANAHGATTLLVVRRADFKKLLSQHVELYEALLRLNCRRLRLLFARSRTSTRCRSRRGWPSRSCCWRAATASQQGDEMRIGLQLAQEDIAQLLGASRQRVNQELKGFEREGAMRIEPTRLVVLVARPSCSRIAEPMTGVGHRPVSTVQSHHDDRTNTGTKPVAEQHAFDIAALER